jgi:hypothetical protein
MTIVLCSGINIYIGLLEITFIIVNGNLGIFGSGKLIMFCSGKLQLYLLVRNCIFICE